MKINELREMNIDEIQNHRRELEKEIFNLKIRQATKQGENPLRIRTLRRELARISTILKEDALKIRLLAVKGESKNA